MIDRWGWDAMATLVDSGRRALFEYVQRASHAVSREEAAEAVGMSRGLAAFHLDKLVDAGLLRTRYEAPADLPRTRGRTPKVYEPAAAEITVSVPEREYGLVAQILADAVAEDPRHADVAAHRGARDHGRWLGAELHAAGVTLLDALDRAGYEPDHQPGDPDIVLRNCPFHTLAQRQTALICGLNLELLTGLLEGLAATGCTAELSPGPGRCCVLVSTSA